MRRRLEGREPVDPDEAVGAPLVTRDEALSSVPGSDARVEVW